VVPDDARLQHDVYIHPGQTALPHPPRPGDKVVVKLDPWEDRYLNPEGEIIEVLGGAREPHVDVLSVLRKYHLPVDFPAEVLREAERIPESVDPSEIGRREDLRNKTIVTIDPDDARDYDDAIHVEPIKGGWRLGVHIADVSHYVRPGSALDREARKRGNSTYLVDRVVPMLPERLSNGICSLKPDVDRLTFTAFIDFNHAGKIKAVRFARTVIRSAARLSYRQALAILHHQTTMPPLPPAMKREEARGRATVSSGPTIPIDPVIAKEVLLAWDLASVLRRDRFATGSLDLDFPEVKIWLDDEGRAVRMEKMENDISHQLIEECMLAANEVVARELERRSVPTIYRVHENPDPARLAEYRQLAGAYGIRVGDLTSRSEVQKLLAAIKGTAEEHALKINFLKSLKRAAYDTRSLGHYGLHKANYTHFTSPIRRYADLVVHRSLADLVSPPRFEEGDSRVRRAQPDSVAQLAALAVHISDTERNSAEAEKDSIQLKKMEFFQRQIETRKPEVFSAVVIDVRSYGLFIEIPSINVSGMIHVSDLPEDFYAFDPVRLVFKGRRTKREYKVGEIIPVVVSRVDARKRQIDFIPARDRSAARPKQVSTPEAIPPLPSRPGKQPRQPSSPSGSRPPREPRAPRPPRKPRPSRQPRRPRS
jgi:ribonuclease R